MSQREWSYMDRQTGLTGDDVDEQGRLTHNTETPRAIKHVRTVAEDGTVSYVQQQAPPPLLNEQEHERSLVAATHLHHAVHALRQARSAMLDEVVPLVVIHEVEALMERLSITARARP